MHKAPRIEKRPADVIGNRSGHRMFALVDPNGSLLRCMSPLDRG